MRNPKTQKTFVLVDGSWQGAWCWDGVRERLRKRGHRVLAPALPAATDTAVCQCASDPLIANLDGDTRQT